MIVADSSALLDALLARPPDSDLLARLSTEGGVHVPHLVDLEVAQVLGRLVRAGRLSLDRASDALRDYVDLTLVRYPHEPFLDRIWELRPNLTAYDAAFVALSEALDAPLVTTDARLAGVPGIAASVEVYPRS
ncbi:MAG TPA: type II toxin-antitoxin system VapC family toxin [Gaiellaceae bacterium]|nr:type II toxin-antitoxin system VapC family toxin [Gaiellaceae bacterium]